MGENTKIEWATHTFNPWIGCQNVSEACDHCYAETQNNHRKWNGGEWGPHAPRKRTSAANWRKPLQWANAAADAGVRHRVFCASLADVFDNKAPPKARADLFDLINATRELDWLLLTKRPENIAKMLPADWRDGYPNVWLGTSTENQRWANHRIPILLGVPAAKHFISAEPMLGPINIMDAHGEMLDWVICGGESGGQARAMNAEWARDLRDQCSALRMSFLFKQWGEHGESGARVGKKFAGRRLDGRLWDGIPQ